MDPVVVTIGAMLGLGITVFAVAIVAFWTQILMWSEQALYPWLEKNISLEVANLAREAFVEIDRAVAPLRRVVQYANVKRAWNKLRNYLLGEILEIEKQAHNSFVRRIKVYIKDEELVKEVVKERTVSFEELPQSIRADFIRKNSYAPLDVVRLRDKEIMELIS